jgi:phosphoglucomutase
MDQKFSARVETMMLQPELLKKRRRRSSKSSSPRCMAPAACWCPSLLKKLGFNFLTVPEQDVRDGPSPP